LGGLGAGDVAAADDADADDDEEEEEEELDADDDSAGTAGDGTGARATNLVVMATPPLRDDASLELTYGGRVKLTGRLDAKW
jgi:hypothetical protein